MIDESKINEIIDKTDMVGLVSEFVTLSKRGKNYFGLCPFHDDQSPSFSVSPDKKIAKCMSCGEGGNPINFLRKIKNISFEDACFQLANRVGVNLNITKKPTFVDENQKYYQINQIAKEFYEHFLYHSQTGKEALNYLYKRGLTDETIKMFGIGLAPKAKDTLYKVLKDKKFNEVDIEDVGLIKENKDGYYDMFSKRIMFPIIDDSNHVLGFSGRIFGDDDPNQPKYVNTEETKIYHKGNTLYNLNNAIMSIRKKGRVILMEGQMDVISASNANIKEVVCSLGTALTKDQVSLIKKYAKNVVICYDGDSAGQKATHKAFNLLKDIPTTTITLPDGMDPDEFIKKYGASEFIDFINKNQNDIYEFSFLRAFSNRDLNNVYDYEEAKKEVFKFLSLIRSTSLIEKYLRRLSEKLKVSYEAIFNDYNLYSKSSVGIKNVEFKDDIKKNSKEIKSHEKMFLAFLIYDKKYLDLFDKELDGITKYIQSDIATEVYVAISCFYSNNDVSRDNLIKFIYQETNNDIVYELMNLVMKISSYSDETKELVFNDCVKRFLHVKFNLERSEYRINSNEVTDEVTDMLQKKLDYVRKNVNKK